MKKTLLIVSVLAFFSVAPHVLAQGFVALSPIPGLTDAQTANSATNLASFLNNLYKYLIGIAAVLAVIEIIWGGLQISTQDSVSKKGEGKERITQAILGLILVLSPVLVFSIINPSILNLSLDLPELNTVSGTPTGFGGTPTSSGSTGYCYNGSLSNGRGNDLRCYSTADACISAGGSTSGSRACFQRSGLSSEQLPATGQRWCLQTAAIRGSPSRMGACYPNRPDCEEQRPSWYNFDSPPTSCVLN